MKRRRDIWSLILETTFVFFIFFMFFVSVPFAQSFWSERGDLIGAFDIKKNIVIAESVLQVYIADSSETRKLGLSGRESLTPGTGMLFDFKKSDLHSIWMKDMLFSIDIIWIAENMQVVHLEKDVSPKTYPKRFTSDKKARYVLEVPSGFIQKEGIKVGDLLVTF